MEKITNTETALLGLLSEQPMHPYKIEQEVKFRDMRFWTELSMSSIYKLLRKLEKNGLVDSEKEISLENRLKKIYKISRKGTELLKRKIEKLLSESEHMRWQVDLATYNCHLLPPKKIIELLKKYRDDIQKKIIDYCKLEKFMKELHCNGFRLEVARRPVFLLKGELAWIDSFIEKLAE